MKAHRVTSVGLAVLMLALSAAASPGATRLVQSFGSLSSGSVAGELLTVNGLRAWRAGRGARDLVSAAYLRYPAAGALNPEAGTIEIELVRGSKPGDEALFNMVDAGGRSQLAAVIAWAGEPGNPWNPSISFIPAGDREMPGAWNTVQTEQALRQGISPQGLSAIPSAAVYLPHKVPVGRRVHLAFTWGPAEGDCAVYADGVKLDSFARDPSTMPRTIAATDSFLVGAEVSENHKNAAYTLLSSPVIGFRTSDQPLTPAQFMRSPRILAVGHNAARVAGYSGFLVEGQELTVTLEAETGGKASCDIGDIRDIPLAELADRPGSYEGTYRVKGGDFVDQGAVVGRFRNLIGLEAEPFPAQRPASLDGRVHLAVNPSNDLVPADKSSKVGVTVVATDANGRKLRNHPVKLTLSTTDEYTGLVGSGTFGAEVGGAVVVDWGGVTDSFGEVTAQYQAGFAAKTVMVNAKDMLTGDLGFGAIRSFIEGRVDIVVKEPAVSRLLAARGVLEVSASRSWLTADGSSRSRITARVLGTDGKPVQGDQISFTLSGNRGQIKVIQARTDSSGRAYADYIAGTLIGQVQIEVRDLTMGLVASLPIELRADAPAEIILRAAASEVLIGGKPVEVLARVSDVNGNPNSNTEVQFALAAGDGVLSAPSVLTDAREGKASVTYTPGSRAGITTIRATVVSRLPTASELASAAGAVFLYGIAEDPGELTVREWKAEANDQVVKGQELVVLADRKGNLFTVKAPRDGILSVRGVEQDEAARMGDTLAYVLPLAE